MKLLFEYAVVSTDYFVTLTSISGVSRETHDFARATSPPPPLLASPRGFRSHLDTGEMRRRSTGSTKKFANETPASTTKKNKENQSNIPIALVQHWRTSRDVKFRALCAIDHYGETEHSRRAGDRLYISLRRSVGAPCIEEINTNPFSRVRQTLDSRTVPRTGQIERKKITKKLRMIIIIM